MSESERESPRGRSRRRILPGTIFLASLGGACLLFLDLPENLIRRSKPSQARLVRKEKDERSAIIPVEGLSCAACVARVKKTLENMEGVEAAEVSLTERNVKVSYLEKRISTDQIVAAINSLGYKAQPPSSKAPTDSSVGPKQSRSAVLKSEPRFESVRIPVDGMACGSCAATVENALRDLDGVIKATVDFQTKKASVQYDVNRIDVKGIVDEIGATGFEPGSPVGERSE